MDDADETSSDFGNGNWFVGAVHIECVDSDLSVTFIRWSINLRHYHFATQNHRRQRATAVCIATLHLVRIRRFIETG